ncbi:MAG: hypothetical protein KME22_13390 [Hassallia sp. WJT32-NPBG1]|jgi:hypothetical protein|nr:hypothetical protein [Hassallia sp. WJT32-NPBG1]
MPVKQSAVTLLVFLYYKESDCVVALSEAIAKRRAGTPSRGAATFPRLNFRRQAIAINACLSSKNFFIKAIAPQLR